MDAPTPRRTVIEALEGRCLLAQTPFSGTPFPVGAGLTTTIQAENYDKGGEGVAYHDTTPTTNTAGVYRTGSTSGVEVKRIDNTTSQYRIGDAHPGEWVEYTIDVKQSGLYRLDLRLSQKDPNARVHVEVGGTNLTGSVSVPDTNSFSSFATVSRNVQLSSGQRVLRLAFDAKAVNGTVAGVDWLRLSRATTGSTPSETGNLDTLRRKFLDMKYGMFLHFGFDTWTDGDGAAQPDVNKFNPKSINTDQWASVAKSAGMKYGVLTTKHGSGFALWDSSRTTYDVAGSNWGKARKAAGKNADVVRMYVDSFRKQGLGVGLYYQVFDRKAGINSGSDPRRATDHVKAELTQLLTNYGQIQVLWTDAWKWKVGYSAVNWREVYDHIKRLSPNTLLMENNHEGSYAHTDVVGYESPTKSGVPSGNRLAAEVSDTIRSGDYWFYRTWDPPLRSVSYLANARITANNRNANYLLNVGPDRNGLIPTREVNHLKAVQAEYLKRT